MAKLPVESLQFAPSVHVLSELSYKPFLSNGEIHVNALSSWNNNSDSFGKFDIIWGWNMVDVK